MSEKKRDDDDEEIVFDGYVLFLDSADNRDKLVDLKSDTVFELEDRTADTFEVMFRKKYNGLKKISLRFFFIKHYSMEKDLFFYELGPFSPRKDYISVGEEDKHEIIKDDMFLRYHIKDYTRYFSQQVVESGFEADLEFRRECSDVWKGQWLDNREGGSTGKKYIRETRGIDKFLRIFEVVNNLGEVWHLFLEKNNNYSQLHYSVIWERKILMFDTDGKMNWNLPDTCRKKKVIVYSDDGKSIQREDRNLRIRFLLYEGKNNKLEGNWIKATNIVLENNKIEVFGLACLIGLRF